VDVLVVEQAAVIEDLGRAAADDLRRLQHPRLVDVGDGDHLLTRQLLELPHETAGAAAGADHADADAVVRPQGGGRRRPPPGQERRGGSEGGSEEAAPSGRVALFFGHA
jgi:hypothetical protein